MDTHGLEELYVEWATTLLKLHVPGCNRLFGLEMRICSFQVSPATAVEGRCRLSSRCGRAHGKASASPGDKWILHGAGQRLVFFSIPLDGKSSVLSADSDISLDRGLGIAAVPDAVPVSTCGQPYMRVRQEKTDTLCLLTPYETRTHSAGHLRSHFSTSRVGCGI